MTSNQQTHERIDDLHRNGYRLIQNPKSFCFGVDAVLLSDYARVADGECALDLCTGNGVIPILLCAKTVGRHFTGLEIQQESVDLAKRSVALNGLADKINIVCADLKEASQHLALSSFDVVTCNPPYIPHGGGIVNENAARAMARHEILCSLTDVLGCAAALLRPLGRFYMVHRPHRLADIFAGMHAALLEPKTLRFVHPYANAAPTMVLISATRGGKPFLKVEPPLVMYQEKGVYTDEIKRIYYE